MDIRKYVYLFVLTCFLLGSQKPAHAQTFELNRLTTKVTPSNVALNSLDEQVEFHIQVINNSSVKHSNISFNYSFKPNELEIVNGCIEVEQGELEPGESLVTDCSVKVKPGIPEYLGEVKLNIGTLSKVESSGHGSSYLISIKLPQTKNNMISSNLIGCFDKQTYINYTSKYQNTSDKSDTGESINISRYLSDRYLVLVLGLIVGIYLLPKKGPKKRNKKLDFIIPTLVIAGSMGLLGYRLLQDKCQFFPTLNVCTLKQKGEQKEREEFTELLRGEGGIQVEQEILDNQNVLLKDGYGRWQIEYPPYFTNQFLPETKTVVISGPSANANPDTGILTVQARIDVFEKELLSDFDAFRKVVYERIAGQGVSILSESETTFNFYDAKLITVRDSSFNNGSVTADGKIYFFETSRSYILFALYTNDNCNQIFGDEIKKLIQSFILLDEGVNKEI